FPSVHERDRMIPGSKSPALALPKTRETGRRAATATFARHEGNPDEPASQDKRHCQVAVKHAGAPGGTPEHWAGWLATHASTDPLSAPWFQEHPDRAVRRSPTRGELLSINGEARRGPSCDKMRNSCLNAPAF
ncbi:MAG: hypothetical protein KDD97_09675, partial [Rhodobacteraceae bacterium]|nr:hypothetical protein [Paracoccaceae bacterium]